MIACITCTTAHQSERIVLRQGQFARVGTSAWAELPIPNGQNVKSIHFTLRFGDQLRLDCEPEASVLFKKQSVTQLELEDGMVFSVKDTQFHVRAKQSPRPHHPAMHDRSIENDCVTIEEHPWQERVDWQTIDCEPEQLASLKGLPDLRTAAASLLQSGKPRAALVLFAQGFSQQECVRWAMKHIPCQSEELESVEQWLANPTETQREIVAQELTAQPNNAIDWLRQSVAWTGGSLAPANSPKVPPPESLCKVGCATALLMPEVKLEVAQLIGQNTTGN